MFDPTEGTANLLSTLGGDDTVVMLGLGPGTITITGSGGDTVHICTAIESDSITLGDGSYGHDGDADHVIFHPEVFDHAARVGGVELFLHQFNSINDRLSFILPEGVDASVQIRRDSAALKLRIGPLTLALPVADAKTAQRWPTPDPQVQIERAAPPLATPLVAPPVPAATMPERTSRPPYVTPSADLRAAMPGCAGVAFALDWAAADATQRFVGGNAVDGLGFATGATAFVPDGYDSPVMASVGDDRFVLHDATDYTSVNLGAGRDTMVFCNMLGVHTEIALSGAVGGATDSAPDVLVIDRPVFEDVPAGQLRKIVVQTFVPEHDRLILVTPGGQIPQMQLRNDAFDIVLGDVLVEIWRRPNTNTEQDFRAAITITEDPDVPLTTLMAVPPPDTPDRLGPTAGLLLAAWADARSFAGALPEFAPPAVSCDDPAAAGFVMTEELPYSRPYPDFRAFSAGPDIVALTAMPDTEITLDMGEGDDTLYDAIGAGQIMLGMGADRYIFCANMMSETWIMTEPDTDSDLFIIGPEVLREQPGSTAALRHILIHGFVDVNDRLVLVLPQGATVVRSDPIRGVNRDSLTVMHQDQETLIEIFPHRAPGETGHLRDSAFVFVPEAAASQGDQP